MPKRWIERVFTIGFAFGLTAEAWYGDINGRRPLLKHDKALIIQPTVFNERAYDSGIRDAMRTLIDEWGFLYPGVKAVEHVYFYAARGKTMPRSGATCKPPTVWGESSNISTSPVSATRRETGGSGAIQRDGGLSKAPPARLDRRNGSPVVLVRYHMTNTRMLAGICASAFLLNLAIATGQPASPPAETSVTIDGKVLKINYAAPSVKGRKIFGDGGRISKDPTYPVWRTGANSATKFHTDADLDIGGLKVPAGDYSIFTKVDTDTWDLIINKQVGQWGLRYDAAQDLGRVKMTMSKPPALVETFKITLSATGGKNGKLVLEWENTVASVNFKVQ